MTPATIPRLFNFTVFESINNPVFVMDKLGTWIYCNRAFEIFSGMTTNAIQMQLPSIRRFLRFSAAWRCADSNTNFFANNLQAQSATITDAISLIAKRMYVHKYILRNKQNRASGFIGVISNLDQADETYLDNGLQHPETRPLKVEAVNRMTLSAKELQVLNLIAFGYSTKKIASLLGNSVHTITGHQKSIYLKLNAHSKIEVINAGRVKGLLKQEVV